MTQNTLLKRYEHIVGMMGELSYNLPDVFEHFDDMRLASMLESSLDTKTKSLIGLGLAIASGGEGWIEHFMIRALQNGADRQETLEIIGVALLMGGGAVMKSACDAYETLQAFELRDQQHKAEAVNDAVNAAITAAEQEEALSLAAAR